MARSIRLPKAGGGSETWAMREATSFPAPAAPPRFDRIAYSAAHVVSDPRAATDPWLAAALDWDATIAYRQRLWSLGLGVAEDAPYRWTLPEGAKGVQLVEAALQSWQERRWIDVPALAL